MYRESGPWCTTLGTPERCRVSLLTSFGTLNLRSLCEAAQFCYTAGDARAGKLPAYSARPEPADPGTTTAATGVLEMFHVFFLLSKHQLHPVYWKQGFLLQTLKALGCSLNYWISKLSMRSQKFLLGGFQWGDLRVLYWDQVSRCCKDVLRHLSLAKFDTECWTKHYTHTHLVTVTAVPGQTRALGPWGQHGHNEDCS